MSGHYFYANSNSKQEANWDQGVLSGSWTEWYADGQKRMEGEIKDGLAIGVWTEWYADGTKSFEGTRKRSVKKKNGLFGTKKFKDQLAILKVKAFNSSKISITVMVSKGLKV